MTRGHRRFLAIVIGIALAGVPVAALNIWLHGSAERQAHEELEVSVRRHLAISERSIASTISVLEWLAEARVDSCGATDITALRQATFDTIAVKELSIVSADGWTLCTDMGNRTVQREVISSGRLPSSSGADAWLEVLRLEGRPERWVRIRHPSGEAGKSIAALLPATLFVPRVSTEGEALSFHVQMFTGGGALIAETGALPAGKSSRDLVKLTISSNRYAIKAVASGVPSQLASSYSDLRVMGFVVSVLLMILVVALVLLQSERNYNNPIAELERAIKAGEFVPYFEPIVDITTGKLRGAEVLIRWRKPDGTIILPSVFLPLAESSGLITEMTRTLMRRVCQETGAVYGPRPHLKIGFNLTAGHFANDEIINDVRAIFSDAPLRLSQVVLEMTEHQPLESLTETRLIIAALQALGIRIAIDDVGAGHSGLSYLLKLGADAIKIDKLFIDAVDSDHGSKVIIEMLVDMAQNLRMDVVAEGVERFEQVMKLRDLGVRAVQGYVFSPPLPASSFLELVEAIDPLNSAADQPPMSDEKTPARSDAA